MPNDRWTVGCLLSLFLAGCGSAPPADTSALDGPKQTAAAKEKKTIVWGPVTSGLQTRIWFEHNRLTFKVGDPVRIRFAVKNAGDKEQIILRRGFWPNHRVDAFLGEKNAPLTKNGEKVRKLFGPGGTEEKTSPQVVKPGTVVESFEPVDLATLYDLSKVAEYRVKILYEDGVPITSNELTFKIIDP